MREIVLDTETTGLNPLEGHRIVEIGAVELVHKKRTGNTFHVYLNPERAMPKEAFEVHGLSDEFLKDKPLFSDISQEFLEFISGTQLVIHNASFDLKFLNYELSRLKHPEILKDTVLDTLLLARNKHPAGPNNLDALCKRYGVANTHRQKHGALLDADILVDVYIELMGGRQASLGFEEDHKTSEKRGQLQGHTPARVRPQSLPSRLTEEERKAHQEFIKTFSKESLWNGYLG